MNPLTGEHLVKLCDGCSVFIILHHCGPSTYRGGDVDERVVLSDKRICQRLGLADLLRQSRLLGLTVRLGRVCRYDLVEVIGKSADVGAEALDVGDDGVDLGGVVDALNVGGELNEISDPTRCADLERVRQFLDTFV